MGSYTTCPSPRPFLQVVHAEANALLNKNQASVAGAVSGAGSPPASYLVPLEPFALDSNKSQTALCHATC